MKAAERTCILSFDEMNIDGKLCYDTGEDQILGPFSKVQVVLARGIMLPWKQPVYFNFNTRMNKELLFNIINHLYKTGLIDKAIVADLAGCSTLWKELKITADNTSFDNLSQTDSKVWVFAEMLIFSVNNYMFSRTCMY